MPEMNSLDYIWERLPLALLFASGYLAYRLLAVSQLTDWSVRWAVRKSRGAPRRIVFYMIAVTAFLSAFIPNAITVLAVLPVVTALDREHSRRHPGAPLTTALALATMYGANIGGMASLIGSPANLILLGVLDLYHVPGREQINFFNWFLWGVPLAVILMLLGWALIAFLTLPGGQGQELELVGEPPRFGQLQRLGARLYCLFLGFWILEAMFKELWPGFAALETPVSLVFFVWFCLESFRGRTLDGRQEPLLNLRSLFVGLPAQGLFWLAVILAMMLAANFLGLDRSVAGFLAAVIGALDSPPLMIMVFAMAAIFLTEVLSNTVVAVALFPVAFFAAQAAGLAPLPLMIAVSVAATCAFMTPVATVPNALVYGSLRGVSLRAMLVLGCCMNLLGALLMSGWLCWIIPLLYGRSAG